MTTSIKKTIFVCEFITAGGFSGEPLVPSLVSEGTLMRDQLCNELSQCHHGKTISMHDERLPPTTMVSESIAVSHNFHTVFKQCLQQADVIFLIAPEFDDILYELTRQAVAAGLMVIGAGLDTVQIASDKLRTAALLKQSNIDAPLSFNINDWANSIGQFSQSQAWLAKPVKGVGCEGITVLQDTQAVQSWMNALKPAEKEDYFLQMFLEGDIASLSMCCHQGKAWLLSCNQLIVKQIDNTICLDSIKVNGFADAWQQFEKLAQGIAESLPNETAYLGVDVVMDTENKTLSVLEINPRLTSSYVGLAHATGLNVAQNLMQLSLEKYFAFPMVERNLITIKL